MKAWLSETNLGSRTTFVVTSLTLFSVQYREQSAMPLKVVCQESTMECSGCPLKT